MAYTATGQTYDAIQQADEDRTKRAFVGFLSSALGIDQTYANDDFLPSNQTGQYIIANPDGSFSQVGRSVSNLQTVQGVPGFVLTPGMVVLAIAGYLLFRKS
jgi:hypothetical protein